MPKQVKQTITLRNLEGEETAQVQAVIVGCYGVHKSYREHRRISPYKTAAWTVTHIPSGILVRYYRLRSQALDLAQKLIDEFGDTSSVAYWDKETGKIVFLRSQQDLLSKMYEFVKEHSAIVEKGKRTMAKQEIILRDYKTGIEQMRAQATVIGSYGVHRFWSYGISRRWAVSHIASGQVMHTYKYIKDARGLAIRLTERLGDTSNALYWENGERVYGDPEFINKSYAVVVEYDKEQGLR